MICSIDGQGDGYTCDREVARVMLESNIGVHAAMLEPDVHPLRPLWRYVETLLLSCMPCVTV